MQGNSKQLAPLLCLLLACFGPWLPSLAADQVDPETFRDESLFVPVHSFASQEEAIAWSKLPAPKAELEQLIFQAHDNFSAEQNALQFVASINAISAMLYFGDNFPNLSFSVLAPEELKQPELLAQFGDCSIWKNLSYLAPDIAPVGARIRWQEMLKQYYSQNPDKAKALLRELWIWVQANIVEAKSQLATEITAAAMNAFIQTSDPHARLSPLDFYQSQVNKSIPSSFSKQMDLVGGQLLNTPNGIKVGYLSLPSFNGLTGAIASRIKQLESQGAIGFIIDLRKNSGGFIWDTQQFLNIFLDASTGGRVLFYTTKPGENTPLEAYESKRAAETKKLLVVLVDARTKSAAELAAGVLQSYKRAWIMGDITYGKGSYLEVTRRIAENVILYESTKVLHYANGGSPQLSGVEPDFLVNADRWAARELNMYPNPLSRETPHFIQTRQCEIQNRTACMNTLEKNLPADSDALKAMDSDYTLARSILLMQCLTTAFSCR